MAKSKKIKIAFPIPLPFGEDFRVVWEKWLRYRGERGLPAYKPTGLEITFEMIVEESGKDEARAVEAIKFSMGQNWQGIFFKRNNGNNGNETLNGGNKPGGTSSDRLDVLRNW